MGKPENMRRLGKLTKLSGLGQDGAAPAAGRLPRRRGAGRPTLRHKSVFSTGDVARICGLSQQTVIRCFDEGQLQGFRVPGSKFRRIPRESLIRFMKANSIPLELLEGQKIRVLVVDDDTEVVELFGDVLKADGRFEVASAQTGYEAGVLTQEFKPDVVVLDFMLPDINGDVVCRAIRGRQELKNTRILAISGMAAQAEIDRILAAGADEFIKKPFNIETVVERIVKLANRG